VAIGRPNIWYAPNLNERRLSVTPQTAEQQPAFLAATLPAVRPGTRSMRRGDITSPQRTSESN
jgi:hypothetical protein